MWSAPVLLAPGSLRAQSRPGLRTLEAAHQVPANLSGREFVYDYKTDTIVVRGDALLTQGATSLSADELDYTRNRGEARAFGHVHLVDPEVELKASQAELDLLTESGHLLDAQVNAKNHVYHLEGSEIAKYPGQRYSIRNGFFTTCGCEEGSPAWSIGADKLDLHLGGTGSASGARFNILGRPVIKVPYLVFPADTDRSSGLLSPRLGQSRLRGFQFVQPLYFAINKSSDATVALDVETSARVGFLSEYRLQNGEDDYFRVSSAIFDESLRVNRTNDLVDTQIADQHVPLDRYGVFGITRQHLTPDLTLFGDTITVSDSLYLREMNLYAMSRGYGSNFGILRDPQSHFGLLQSFEDGFVRLEGTWNQDLIQDQRFALQTLPELLASGRQDLGGGFAYSDYDVQGVDFWRRDGVKGFRVDLDPRLTVPWRLSDYVFGYGTAGVRETVYDASGDDLSVIPVGTAGLANNDGLAPGALNQGGLRSRELLFAGAGASSVIERVYDLNWESVEKIKHTLEPLVSYSYVPDVAQGKLPLFDEVDRVNPRNLVTYGFTSRLFVKSTPPPSEGQDGTSAQAVEEDEDGSNSALDQPSTGYGVRQAARLTLLQAYDLSHRITPNGSQMSDLNMDASIYPTGVAMFGSQLGYSPDESRISYANVYLSLRPPWTSTSHSPLYMGRALSGGPFLEITYDFVGGSGLSHTFAARAYYELFDRVGLYYAPVYDIAGGKLLSSEYGLRVKSTCDCWAVDFGVSDTINPSEVQFQFQVTLGGLGSIGHNPFGRNPFHAYLGSVARAVPVLY